MPKRLRDVHVDRVYKEFCRVNSMISKLTVDDVLTQNERGFLVHAQSMLANAHDEMQSRLTRVPLAADERTILEGMFGADHILESG